MTPHTHPFEDSSSTIPPQRASANVALRLLSGIGGLVVLLSSGLMTLGTSLAAPLGIFVGRRLALRKGRQFSGFLSWISAGVASSSVLLLVVLILMALIPRSTWREMHEAVAAAEAQDTTQLPEWITRAFPQAAQPDPVTQRIVGSPAFTGFFGMVGVVIACAIFGTIAGSAGWLGAFLLSYALRGGRAA